ncbi:protein phosphatase 1 regulatory subunit 3A [Oryctolagus cuniculus]|uniref:Protein phosphatase 1 regulatory subunit 3A n=1 Tax=Oryctolagus cuniculus TaxID=9986 RepID=PPR3A_RABIT|nr:protein phosphatase 1 regulatory subunit 3A [Oryctolagus cuniculus]Q00756.1 RecName: Full=Protein phosphatase 1 regulatory subunit 3A; AltName: Full=Protein phosphatase 1 glycogen-associated regulatory subunit; AltName: Full=Protein phosphatase type-1 glycogen targeting subunit; Short=RG1 [Oryctolagus cuniculus]AAA31462.1 protein phosphatase regulatory subunit [Oryctolagus cuniculus]
MEPSEVPGQNSKDNFLEVPNLSDSLCEDEEVKAIFKPGFSPQPSRRGSESSEEVYVHTASSGGRRVSFADNFGFNLVSVKEFDTWELPSVSTTFELGKDAFQTEEYVLSPLFDLPASKEDLMQQLQVQKAMLESTEYVPGSTSMKGIIRVLNISFEKLVYVRMSLDDWQTHYDILAEYVPNSCDGETDQFSFKISLVPPYQKDGSKVEFCIRYETSVGTFWSNNNGTNYTLVCQKKEPEPEPGKPLEEAPSKQKKGCLKVKSSKEESSETSEENNFENSKIADTYIPTIVCSHEEKEDLKSSYQNVKDVNTEHDEHNEKELELMINQRLIRTRCAASEYGKNTLSSDPSNIPNKPEELQKNQSHSEACTDLSQRLLSPGSSAESSLKGDFYHTEKYSSGNESSHQPSDMGEINPSLGGTTSDGSVQLHISSKEILDDNANPAHGSGRGEISCSFPGQLKASNLNKKYEGGAENSEMKDCECLPRDVHLKASDYFKKSTENRPSEEDYGTSKDNKEKRIQLDVDEKTSKNFRSIFYDQERNVGHLEITVEGIEASDRDLTSLPTKDTTIPTWAIMEDTFHSSRTPLGREEAVLTTPEHDLSSSEGTILGGLTGGVCSPRNGNVLKNDYLFQVEKRKSGWINPEDQNKDTQHQQSWNVLESQEKARGSKTNIAEQIKEQVDCEDMWEKRDNTGSLKATPAEALFTCQEAEHCELSPLADHGIPGKAEAGTAYIIKTTSETTPESMSAGEKAIIAKLPQETARSDRPMEVKETAFDPHEGRNDDSHYTLCQRDTVGVIDDNGVEKESHLDICNARLDEMRKEEAMSMHSPGKMRDREKLGIGNITSVEESSQVIANNEKATSRLDLHLEMPSADKKIFPENRDLGQVQELSKKTDIDNTVHSAFNSDTNRASRDDSLLSSHHTETSVLSCEQANAVKNTVTTTALQTSATESEYNCSPTRETQGQPASKPEEVSRGSRRVTSETRKEKCVGQMFQSGECNVEMSQGPMILVSESRENVERERHENEGLINSGDKEFESSASSSLPVQETQDQSNESLLSKYTNSKIPYFLLFLMFLVTVYHYDLMIGLAFYLFSLYWLYWEEGRQKESVKKK